MRTSWWPSYVELVHEGSLFRLTLQPASDGDLHSLRSAEGFRFLTKLEDTSEVVAPVSYCMTARFSSDLQQL